MIDWANEELSVFQGHLTFLKLGSVRIISGRSGDPHDDVTDQYIELLERYIEEWTQLMSQHNIAVGSEQADDFPAPRTYFRSLSGLHRILPFES